ncbi:hypothetical protein BTVI_97024 [Pitangus sulphuratus]|nr:hypothetical protein BTVI_97024 [Pitangus sulphuratus]
MSASAAFQSLILKPGALNGEVFIKGQDLAFHLVKTHTIDPDHPDPLQSLPILQQINTPAHLGVVCELTEMSRFFALPVASDQGNTKSSNTALQLNREGQLLHSLAHPKLCMMEKREGIRGKNTQGKGEVFNIVSNNILLSKLERVEFAGWTVQWMRNLLNGCIQSAVVNGSMFQWTNGVPQHLVLQPVLFNVLINSIDSGIKCTLSRFPNTTKLSDAVDTSEGWDTIQRDLDKLTK